MGLEQHLDVVRVHPGVEATATAAQHPASTADHMAGRGTVNQESHQQLENHLGLRIAAHGPQDRAQ